jgi:hypothetical protein
MFVSLVNFFNNEVGYLLGFLFYFGIWCVIFPYLYLGKRDFLSLFQEENPLLSELKANQFPIILMVLILSISLIMYFIP